MRLPRPDKAGLAMTEREFVGFLEFVELLGFVEFGKGGDSLRQIETRGDWFGFVGFIEFVEFLEFVEFIGRGP